MHTYLFPVFAYLLGSVSSAIIVSRLFRLNDPRSRGSGNPGATNVLRSGHKLAALLTLVGDMLKGMIPVYLTFYYQMPTGIIALTAIAAFLGHLYPIYYGFKGGKGVATALGIYWIIDWRLGTAFVISWLLTAAILRYSSLASLLASIASGAMAFVLFQQTDSLPIVGAIFLMIAFTFKRHQQNIERLRSGKESKIGSAKEL